MDQVNINCKTSTKQITWRPALADLETALALALPVSLPALPPAYTEHDISSQHST